jgi:hypothetical protein
MNQASGLSDALIRKDLLVMKVPASWYHSHLKDSWFRSGSVLAAASSLTVSPGAAMRFNPAGIAGTGG